MLTSSRNAEEFDERREMRPRYDPQTPAVVTDKVIFNVKMSIFETFNAVRLYS